MSITTPTITGGVSRPECPAAGAAPFTAVVPAKDDVALAAWARYAERARGATLFHHPDWSGAVQAAFGHRPQHLLAWRDERVVGVLPLIEVRSPFAGRLLLSVPYGNYGGILADDAGATQALARAAVRLAEMQGARTLELRSWTAAVEDFSPLTGYVGFVRDLPLHPNDLETYLPRKARAAARHARERDELTVRHDASLLPLVWRLYVRSMRRLGSLNYPLRFFEELFTRLGERAWATVVYAGARPVTGTLSLVFGDTVSPYVVGVDERIRGEGATNLLYFAVMERAVRSGLRRFDFGRSRADNHGSAAFKKNQGFAPAPLGYQRYVPEGRSAPNLSPSNPRFAWARQLWPRLPLSLTRAAGSRLARWLPG